MHGPITLMHHFYDNLLSAGLGFAELLAIVLIVALARRRMPDFRLIGVALIVLAIADVALYTGPLIRSSFTWNWLGKLSSLAVTLAAIAAIPSLSWADAGFSWNQHRGLFPAAIAATLICVFGWGVAAFMGGLHFKLPALETLIFQATMPGFQEEPLYRGVTLLLLDRAFFNERVEFLGAPIGWGAGISSVYFGLIHGNAIVNGHFEIAMAPIVIVSIVGFGLAWIRMRTGSLVMSVFAHNLVNVGQQFF